MAELGNGTDLSQESIDIDRAVAHEFQYRSAPQQTVVDKIDHSHTAVSQLANDLIVGVVGELRWKRLTSGIAEGEGDVRRPDTEGARELFPVGAAAKQKSVVTAFSSVGGGHDGIPQPSARRRCSR